MYYIVGICIAHQLYYVVISPKSECSLTGRVDGRSGGESPTMCMYLYYVLYLLYSVSFWGFFRDVALEHTGLVLSVMLP